MSQIPPYGSIRIAPADVHPFEVVVSETTTWILEVFALDATSAIDAANAGLGQLVHPPARSRQINVAAWLNSQQESEGEDGKEYSSWGNSNGTQAASGSEAEVPCPNGSDHDHEAYDGSRHG